MTFLNILNKTYRNLKNFQLKLWLCFLLVDLCNQLLNIIWKSYPENKIHILVGFQNPHTIKATLLLCITTQNMTALPHIIGLYHQKTYQKLINKTISQLDAETTINQLSQIQETTKNPMIKENIQLLIKHHPKFNTTNISKKNPLKPNP